MNVVMNMIVNRLNDYLYNTEHDDINHIIAKFIKKNISEIGNMTIDELANACFVSKSKISKFCKSFGYDNFIDFKDDCINESKTKKVVVDIQKQGLELEFHEHLHKSLTVIKNNLDKIDCDEIDLLVCEVNKADYIFLYGVAYSNLLCKYIQYECDFLNKEVIVLDEKVSKDYVIKGNSLLIFISVDGHGLENDQRIFRKLIKYPVNKWIISTDTVSKQLLNKFNHAIIIPAKETDMKDRRLLIRYAIDIITGRFQYLNM